MFRILDSHSGYPATWLNAPAGSGKTCVIASYVETRQVPCLWYRVDEGDADVATFFYYMGLAAKRLSRKSLPLFTQEYVHGLQVFTLRYFEALYGSLRPDSLIVLDNYERVAEDSSLHQVISQGMGVLPETLRVIVISRKGPLPQFASLQASDKIGRLGWDELRFSLDDARELIRTRRQEDIPDHVLQRLHERTQGWAAGLVLMLQSLKTADIDYRLLEGLSQKDIFDYFAGEILEKADQLTKDFLLKTAFLPSITIEAAEKLTGLAPSARVLATLYESHYFIERYLREKVAYRYHPLFREFLLSFARTCFSPEEVRAIEREAARALLELGQKEDAVDLLIAAKDWGDLVPAILDQASTLVGEGRSMTLEGWIGSLPEEIRSGSGWLLYWLAVCRQPYDPEESRLLFDRSFTLSNQTGDTACALLAWSGAAMSIFYKQGQLQPFDPLIDWLDAFIARGGSFPSLDIEATVACGMMAALLGIRLHHPEFRAWIDRALTLSRSVANASLRLQICYIAASCYMCLGDYGRWAMVVAEMEEMAKSREPLQAILWRHMKANTLNQMGPFDESPFPFIEEGLKISSESGVIAWVPMLLFEGCQGALDRGDFQKAADFLAQLESMLGRAPKPFVLRYHDAAAFYYLGTGDTRRAITHAQQAITFSPVEVAFVPAAAAYLCSAMILTASGLRHEAREYLAAYRSLPRTPSRILEYTSLIVEAVLALDEELSDALDIIRRAFRIGREEGYMTPFYCFIPSLMSRLCTLALKAEVEVEYAQNLIRSRHLFPETPPLDVPHWPWPIRIFTLGRFEILIEEKPIDTTRLQKKPLLLLKALIALGGEKVREETLSELLWPDAEGDAAHSSFRTTLFRLRRSLGSDEAILFHEGQVSLDLRRVWVDTSAFRRLPGEHKKEDASALAVRAVELYRGDFLPGEEEHWVLSLRARMRDRFLRLIVALGGELEKEGRWNEACASYRAALDADDLAEELYQRLMICYTRLGDKASAISAYTRLRGVLKARLEAKPSAKTEALYRQVMAETF